MRRFALCAIIALAMAAPAGAIPRHIHSTTTPGGATEFGAGVSLNAPCEAFLNLHLNVHVGVYLEGDNPNTISTETISGEC